MSSLISLCHVRCNLDRDHNFLDLAWAVERGQHWTVLGPNGSGKTALAGILGGSIPIAQGAIETAPGFDRKRQIGYVSFELQRALYERDDRFDDSELREDVFDPGTSARASILQGCQPDEQFDRLVSDFRLDHVIDNGIRFLSSGEMRKVLILRALLEDPALLILDNPLEGLDRAAQADIRRQLAALMTPAHTTVVLSRRPEDVFDGTTHLMLLADQSVVVAGARGDVEAGGAIERVFPPLPPPVESLPAPDRARPPFRPPAGVPLVKAHDLRVSYHGRTVLDGIDLVIEHGQHTAISGPNGCGKSTLLALISGESDKAYGQSIELFGRRRGSGETVWEVKEKFGVISNQLHQHYRRGWRALEVVISGFYDSIGLYDDYGGCEDQTAREWMAALDIARFAATPYSKLSFGQQRMVLLARAMVKFPPLLVLDEPCTGLDDYYRRLFLRTVDQIARQTQTHLLFVTHLPGELPACINQELEFRLQPDGRYRLVDVADNRPGAHR